MGPRFRVIETTILEDGSKRFRVVDLVEGGSASKHGVFEVRAEAETVCSRLNGDASENCKSANYEVIKPRFSAARLGSS